MSSSKRDVAGLLEANRQAVKRHGLAWVALCLMLAIHILDETLTRFVPLFNTGGLAAGEHLSFLQLPPLSFEVWLTMAVEALIVVSVISPFVFYGMRWTAIISYPFAVTMFLNGLLHLTGSVYLKQAMPGFLSSPLLMFVAMYLLVSVHQVQSVEASRGESGMRSKGWEEDVDRRD